MPSCGAASAVFACVVGAMLFARVTTHVRACAPLGLVKGASVRSSVRIQILQKFLGSPKVYSDVDQV